MSTPQSTINVCSGVLLNNDYIHTIWFDDHKSQYDYFAGKVVKTFSAYTYIRKSWSLKVDATMEQARTWSYLFFTNGNGKTYYYFINNIEYINDNTVELYIELDVMQTYLHEYVLHRCFVDREHSATDNFGDNLLEENLETGEYINNISVNLPLQDLCVLILSTLDIESAISDNETITSEGCMIDGIFSGLMLYAVDVSTAGGVQGLGLTLKYLDEVGKSDAIVSMWMYPKNLIVLEDGKTWDDELGVMKVKGTTTYFTGSTFNQKLEGYTPRNKKLLSYPYNFLYVTNNAGGSAIYRWEYSGDTTSHGINFKVYGALSPDGTIRFVPTTYKKEATNYDEGLLGTQYPTCAWNQDVYKLWLAQNQHQLEYNQATGIIQAVGGGATAVGMALTGNIPGAVAGLGVAVSGANQIGQQLAMKKDKAVQPPQSKGSFSSSINVNAQHQTFTVIKKSIDKTHAQILDNYFDMYGYKTSDVKIPNRNVRENWTYTKTIGCHVSGNICTEDLRKIQSIYDNGVTFWKNGDAIGSYTLSNNPL